LHHLAILTKKKKASSELMVL